jgi:hypothetical protein
MATDGLRPIGLALQTTANTAVPPTVVMNWPGDWEWNPNVNTTVIRSKNNVRTQETRVRVNTKYDEVMFRGASLDLYEFLNVLAITFGVPASGVYKYGAANNGTAGNYGTLKFAYGLAESWQLYNCRGNTLTIQGDAANGTLTYDAGVRGIKSASQPGGRLGAHAEHPHGRCAVRHLAVPASPKAACRRAVSRTSAWTSTTTLTRCSASPAPPRPAPRKPGSPRPASRTG